AVALVARADEIHDVYGDGVGARVRDRQQLEAVRQPILGHAFDRHRGLRRLGREGGESTQQEKRRGSESFQVSQWKRCSAARPARIVAKVRRQRQATAIATAPAASRSSAIATSGAQMAVSTAAGT